MHTLMLTAQTGTLKRNDRIEMMKRIFGHEGIRAARQAAQDIASSARCQPRAHAEFKRRGEQLPTGSISTGRKTRNNRVTYQSRSCVFHADSARPSPSRSRRLSPRPSLPPIVLPPLTSSGSPSLPPDPLP
mmetsp:Transcript_27026/g.81808  ORF Transcript_27026/g.81808 Transcript_27026/m.81808 type:complete len:131 (-) Transcript_27026:488-880(-)